MSEVSLLTLHSEDSFNAVLKINFRRKLCVYKGRRHICWYVSLLRGLTNVMLQVWWHNATACYGMPLIKNRFVLIGSTMWGCSHIGCEFLPLLDARIHGASCEYNKRTKRLDNGHIACGWVLINPARIHTVKVNLSKELIFLQRLWNVDYKGAIGIRMTNTITIVMWKRYYEKCFCLINSVLFCKRRVNCLQNITQVP